MVDAGGPGSVRKCPGVALADLDDVEGFNRSGEEDQLYAFQLSDGRGWWAVPGPGGTTCHRVHSALFRRFFLDWNTHFVVFSGGVEQELGGPTAQSS